MAPVANRFTISLAGSTSSIGTGRVALLNFDQAAQVRQLAALIVDQVGIFLKGFEARVPHRMLQLAEIVDGLTR